MQRMSLQYVRYQKSSQNLQIPKDYIRTDLEQVNFQNPQLQPYGNDKIALMCYTFKCNVDEPLNPQLFTSLPKNKFKLLSVDEPMKHSTLSFYND